MEKSNFTLEKWALILVFLTMQVYSSFAQNQFISEISKEKISLTKTQKSKLRKLERNPVYKSISFVEFSRIENFVSNGKLELNIPERKEKYIARVEEFRYSSEKEYVWKGDFVNNEGNIVIYCKKGEIFGHIMLNNEEFDFQTFGKNNIFIKIDKERVLKAKCGNIRDNNHEKNYNKVKIKKTKKNKSNTGLVRILVLYTSNAQNAVSNIDQTATLAVNQIDDALDNSNVSYSQLHVDRAATKHLNFTENPSDLADDVENRLRTNSTAKNYRNQYQADLVVLLTDGDYHNGLALGKVADIGPINSWAYAIVEADYATSNLTFAHEVAHLFGGRHQNDPHGTYEHGYYFSTGWWIFKKYHRTILGTSSNTYNRIQYYSNPDAEYKNTSTGTSSSNDVARKLREESYTVENFRPYDPPFDVYISGPSKATNSGTYTWSAVISGGTASSYLWEYSYDGINWEGTFGTSKDITKQMPINKDLHLKLTATSTGGEQAIAYHTTINMSNDPHPNNTKATDDTNTIFMTKNSNIENESSSNKITPKTIEINPAEGIYPNPAKTKAHLQYRMDSREKVIISIQSIEGKTIDKYVEKANKGINTKEIKVSRYENGIYFITLDTKSNDKTYKLIINK